VCDDPDVALARRLRKLGELGEKIDQLERTTRRLCELMADGPPVAVDVRDLSRMLRMSDSQIRRMVEDDETFPAGIVLTAGRLSWSFDEVRAWVLSRPRRLRGRDVAAATISALDRTPGRVAS